MANLSRNLNVVMKQLVNLLLLLFVLAVIFFYWATQVIETKQDVIAEWLSSSIAYPVEMGGVKIDWSDYSPKIELQSVRILSQNETTELLTLEKLFLNLDLIMTFWDKTLHVEDLALTGLNMTVIRHGDGQLTLKGLNGSGDSTPIFASLLVRSRALDSFNLNNITIDYIDQQQLTLSGRYRLSTGVIEHESDKWHGQGQFILPPALGKAVKVDVNWRGKDATELKWQWAIKTDSVLAKPFKPLLKWQNIQLQQAIVNVDASGIGQSDKLNTLTLNVNINDAVLGSTQDSEIPPVLVKKLSGQLAWNREDDNSAWRVNTEQLNLHINDSVWPESELVLEKTADDEFVLQAGFMRIEDVGLVAALSGKVPEVFEHTQPVGDIENLDIRLASDLQPVNAVLTLKEVGMSPWKSYPGLNGISTKVEWHKGWLQADFNSHELTVYANDLFATPLYFDSLQGQIQLSSQSEELWQLSTDKLRVWNDDLTIQLDGEIKSRQATFISDIEVNLEQIALAKWQKYSPKKVLSSGFGLWAQDAFLAGEIKTGRIQLQGDMAHFPFQNSESKQHGQFDLAMQVESVDLNYAKSWPMIKGVSGELIGKGGDLVIKSQLGTIADFDFNQVEVKIERYVEHDPILFLESALNGTTQNALNVLQNSPLHYRFGRIASMTTGQGKSDINLSLMVPLTHTDDIEVEGNVSFIDSTLYKTDAEKIAVSKLNGLINFSHESVSAEAITASALGYPTRIDVFPSTGATVVRAQGQISEQSISNVLGANVQNEVKGLTDYQLDVEILEKAVGEFYADVAFTSDLQGITLNLPKPLSKTNTEKAQFKLLLDQQESGDYFQINYNDSVDIAFSETANRKKKITVATSELTIDDWVDWAEKHSAAETGFFAAGDEVLFKVKQIEWMGNTFDQFSLAGLKQERAWDAIINSQQSKGHIYLPDDLALEEQLVIELDKLNISLQSESEKSATLAKGPVKEMDLWPAMRLSVLDLTVNDMALGQLALDSSRSADSWIINSASLNSDLFNLTVSDGVWKKDQMGQQSRIKLDTRSDDLARLLANFGYIQAIEARDVKFSADMNWPSNPLSVSTETLEGDLSLKIGKGQLKDVKAGAAGRVFGLLSVSAIPRRLTLDFNDLFSKGFNFNSIRGDFALSKGQAITNNLTLKSEAADIEITGPIDIINQQYAQKVKVVPNVSSTLPLAGAVAGGPVGLGVGAAILLVDKLAGRLFDKEIVNLISYSYDLTGAWDEPQLTIIKPKLAQ